MANIAEQYFQLFENHLQKNIFYNVEPRRLYDAVNHIMQMPGKRIRPLLLMMSAEMFGGDVHRVLNAAMGIELFHNATLVHDDIMDVADIRRGLPTVHVKYGINHAIVTGDVMMIYAYQYLLQDYPDKMSALIQAYNKTTTEIMEGQTMDLNFEESTEVKAEEYLKMIEYKTSVLLAASLQIGAILAGADEDNQKLIYNFGLNLGLSFQIKDDLLDAFGEGSKVGKKIGGDILRNKKTYLYIRTYELASAPQKQQLEQLLSETDEAKKIEDTLSLMEQSGARKATEELAEFYFNKSIENLKAVQVNELKKQDLFNLAHAVHQRQF